MAYHPDFPVHENSKWSGGGHSTNIQYARSGKSFTAVERSNRLRIWSVELAWLGFTNANTFIDFFRAREGSYDPFYWFAWYPTSETDVIIDLGDSSTTVYNLPFKSPASAPLVYLNDVLKSDPTDYVYAAGGGPGGEDKITFATAPGTGVEISVTWTRARERHYVRFKRDTYETSFRYGGGEIQTLFRYDLEEVI